MADCPTASVEGRVQPSHFARVLARRPLAVILGVLGLVSVALLGVGLPPIQEEFEGYDARSSHGARVYDGFVAARWRARAYMDAIGVGKDAGSRQDEEPLTVELLDYRTIFFFRSLSGDVLSARNLNSTDIVLHDAAAVLSPNFCYKGNPSRAGGSGLTCKPPWTLMSVFKERDATQLKALIRAKDSVLGLGPFLDVFVGADLDASTGRTSWIQGHLRVGAPLVGFHNTSHNASAQRALYDAQFERQGLLGPEPLPEGWITQIDAIISRAERSNPDLKIYYGGRLLYPRIFGYVNQDISYSVVSIVLVGLFMWLQLGSLFLTCMGMLGIVMSLALTVATWKLLGNATMTFMQAMTIYIILGIGADNIFVFADAWKQSRKMSDSLELRLQYSWSRAMRAMTVTSLTTACAFMLTSLADVPAVSTFGTFAALVVAWNYLLVVTWFAAWVVLHDRHLVQMRSCSSQMTRCLSCLLVSGLSCRGKAHGQVSPLETECCSRCQQALAPDVLFCNACGTRVEGKGASLDNHDCNGEVVMTASPSEEASPHVGGVNEGTRRPTLALRAPELFFQNTWYPTLQRGEVQLCALYVLPLAALLGCALASQKVQLAKRPTSEAILKKSHPLQTTFDLLSGAHPAFKAGAVRGKQTAHWAYGIDVGDPINRSGSDALANGIHGLPASFESTRGVANYNGQNLTTEAFQVTMVQHCSALANLSSVALTDEGYPQVYCFMRDFKMYLESRGRRWPVEPSALVNELRAWQADFECEGLGCYRNRRGTGVTQGRQNTHLYAAGTGFLAVGNEIMFAYIGANLSEPISQLDLEVVKPEYQEWSDSARNASVRDGAQRLDVLGLTGRLLWIATVEALVNCISTAVPTSVGLSFLMLTLTTGNWRIAALATLTIVGVMGSFLLTFVAQGHTIGLYEAMFLSITAGFAVDFVVHLAHAYNEAQALHRDEKMREALTTMGVSVLSGAISTLMASAIILLCAFNFLATYGSFVFFVIGWSLLFSLCFFPVLMMTVGPEGTDGDIKWLSRQRTASKNVSSLPSWQAEDGDLPGCGSATEAGVAGAGEAEARMAWADSAAAGKASLADICSGSGQYRKQQAIAGGVIFVFVVVCAVVSGIVLSEIKVVESVAGATSQMMDTVTFQTLLRGAQMRLVHLAFDSLCTNPMRVSARLELTNRVLKNPAQFYISLSKMHMMLRSSQKVDAIMHIALEEAAELSGEVEEEELAMSFLLNSSSNTSEVAAAISDIQENKDLQLYTIEYVGELTIRIGDMPAYYVFNSSLHLADVLNQDVRGWQGLVSSALQSLSVGTSVDLEDLASTPASSERCAKETQCWFTNFQAECCAGALNLTGTVLETVRVHDDGNAVRVFLEAWLASPLFVMGSPCPGGLAAAIHVHNKSEPVSLLAGPALLASILPAADSRVSNVKVELQILPPFLDAQPALLAALRGEGDISRGRDSLQATLVFNSTSSQACHLQQLLARIHIPIDLTSLGAAIRRNPKRDMGRRASDSIVEIPKEFEKLMPTGRSEQTPWIIASGLTDTTMDVDFSFYGFQELDANRALLTLKLNNILLCPLALKTGQYTLQIFSNASGASPAMTATILAIDETIASRDAVKPQIRVIFDRRERVGRDMISPALTGKPFRVLAGVDRSQSDNTMLSRIVESYLAHSLQRGLEVRGRDKAPLAMLTQLFDMIQVSAPTSDDVIRLQLGFELNLPGAVILVGIRVPPMSLSIEQGGVETFAASFRLDINFQGIKANLDADIKAASVACNPLLSAIAFNTAARLAGSMRIGTVLASFPVLLDLPTGMWGGASMFEGQAVFSGASTGYSSEGWCGVTTGQALGQLCNVLSSSLRFDVSGVTARVVSSSSRAPLTQELILEHRASTLGGCTSLHARFPAWSSGRAENASCATHRGKHLDLSYASLTIRSPCYCGAGIGQCAATDPASAWKCEASGQHLRLCRPQLLLM